MNSVEDPKKLTDREIEMIPQIKGQIKFIGDIPSREGLLDTPSRVIRSWRELYSGYNQNPKDVLTVFDNIKKTDSVILLKNIEFYSMCEHHMLPFYGKAHVAYIPNEKIVGISKLARIVDIYARRLQIQENLGQEITDTLMNLLNAKGAACVIEATHMCMRMRGVGKQESIMVTSSLAGAFFSNQAARMELMELLK
jgi:GTP cyclohydrolase I